MEDKDAAIEELLDSMEEEYLKGARAMFEHLKANVTYCNGKDGCSICLEANKFLKKCSQFHSSRNTGHLRDITGHSQTTGKKSEVSPKP